MCENLFSKSVKFSFQAVLPRRADPIELKAIFEKVGFIDLFLFILFYLLIFVCISHPRSLTRLMYSCLCIWLSFSQYASVKKNDEHFMSPQDFVCRFLHAHTDIRLSDEATKLLAGVVDQKKDGLVLFITVGMINGRKSGVLRR